MQDGVFSILGGLEGLLMNERKIEQSIVPNGTVTPAATF